jgi:hypothetical protein
MMIPVRLLYSLDFSLLSKAGYSTGTVFIYFLAPRGGE